MCIQKCRLFKLSIFFHWVLFSAIWLYILWGNIRCRMYISFLCLYNTFHNDNLKDPQQFKTSCIVKSIIIYYNSYKLYHQCQNLMSLGGTVPILSYFIIFCQDLGSPFEILGLVHSETTPNRPLWTHWVSLWKRCLFTPLVR